MKVNSLFLVLGGFLAGAVSGVLVAKEYYLKKHKEELTAAIEELENRYLEGDTYRRGYCADDQNETASREDGPLSSEERKKMKEELRETKKNTEKTAYHRMYKPSVESGREIHPEDYEHPEEEMDEDEQDFIQYQMERKESLYKAPRIISEEDAGELPAYVESKPLWYYKDDEVLVTEEDEVLSDPETFLGNALTKFGFADNDEDVIFVMNYAQETCYEVRKVEGGFFDGVYDD